MYFDIKKLLIKSVYVSSVLKERPKMFISPWKNVESRGTTGEEMKHSRPLVIASRA